MHKHTGKYLIVVLDGGNGVDVNVCLLKMLRQGDEADIRQTLTHTTEHNDPSDIHTVTITAKKEDILQFAVSVC